MNIEISRLFETRWRFLYRIMETKQLEIGEKARRRRRRSGGALPRGWIRWPPRIDRACDARGLSQRTGGSRGGTKSCARSTTAFSRTLCPRYAQNFRNRLTSPRAHQIRIEVALARIREEEEEEAEKEERKPATYAYTRARRAFK